MRTLVRQTLREATAIVICACILGLVYNVATKKGVFSSAPAASTPVAATPTRAPGFVTYDEAAEFFTSGNAIFVDARHEFDYKLGHIKGAVNIPLTGFEQGQSRLATVPKDALIITYCDGVECNSSIELATKIAEAGFQNVRIFFGGWKEWETHHQPTEQ